MGLPAVDPITANRNATTIRRLRDADRERRTVERIHHRCPNGYTAYLVPADTCHGCGWSPLIPIPDIEASARGLVSVYGADAAGFVEALANIVEEVLHRNRL